MLIGTMMQQIVKETAKIVAMNAQTDVLLKRDPEVLLVYLVHLVQKVFKATLEWRDFLVPKETKEILECKVQEDQKETEGKWVCLDFLELMEFQVTWDHLDYLEDQDLMDVMELM